MRRRLPACAAAFALAVVPLAGCGDSDPTPAASAPTATTAGGPQQGPAFGSMDELPGVLKTPPPWAKNTESLQQRLRAIGLPALTAEGEVVHTHQHLDLFVDGEPVPVPDDIGVGASFISPLHTHVGGDGVIHVESATAQSYTLGQFFAVWGVRLDANCIGGSCAGEGKELRAWVNGEPVEGDPTRVLLEDHEEIAIAYGTPEQMPDPVPSSYEFPEGL